MLAILRALTARIRAMFSRQRADEEFSDELREHLDMLTEENVRRGMSLAEARREAGIRLGGATQLRETHRELTGVPFLETLFQDIRYALRTLRKNPGFTTVAVLTLALGIGANTAIFNVVDATLLAPLPVKSASRVVVIWVNNLQSDWSRIGPTGQDYLDWKEQSKSFDDLFLFEHGTGTVTGQGEPEQIAGLRVTTNFGDFFGIKPVLGRTFRRDEAAGRHNFAILSNAYWRRHFGSDPSVVGRGLTLNGEQYTIIGVLPADFANLFAADLVVPFDNEWLKRADSDLGVLGRIKRGATLKQATGEMSVIAQRIAGRVFTEQDNLDHPRVVVIDEALARRFFPHGDAVGKHVQVPDGKQVAREIVGVVGGVRDTGFDQQPRPTIYFPSLQTSDQTMSLVVRTSLPPSSILPAIKNAIWSVDKDQPVFEVRSMDEIISGTVSAQRLAFILLGVFAFLALALAAIGIYGVTSYAVSERTHEIGVRMALGAQPGDVLRLVIAHGSRLAAIGVIGGVVAALALTRLLSSLLFGVSATDPLIFAGVAVLLLIVALAACYIPARRAMRVDPMVALRYE